jgi:hypothetical protein
MITQYKLLLIAPFTFAFFVAVSALASGQAQEGEWTITRSQAPGKLHLSLQSTANGQWQNSSYDWNENDIRGLNLGRPAKHDVQFTIAREAGTLAAEGFARNGDAIGLYTFQPNPQYIPQMQSLGFSGIGEDELIAFALHDVSFAYAKEIKALGLPGLDASKLLSCRIFDVNTVFVNELRALGLNALDADKLIAFRIQKVTPDFIRNMRASGLAASDPEKLIAFRIHGVTPDYVRQLEQLGFTHPNSDQLIALRIHGITPEYIQKLRAQGMQHLTIDQLITLGTNRIE